MKRILIALFTVFALIIGASGCSTVSTEPDEVALHYSGGSFSSKNFKNCVDASTRNTDGAGDKHYIYPKGQRTYSFTGAEGSERGPMAVTTGSQELQVPGFVTFTLNTDCDVLREFHEKVGNKYKAYKDGGGWDDFLNDYIAVPLSATLNKAAGSIETPDGATRDQNWELLYNDTATQNEFEDYVKENLPDEIEQTLGGTDGAQFITVNDVAIAKPEIDGDLKESLKSKETARIDADAQKERNVQSRTQYETIEDCLDTGLGEQGCTLIFLSQNGADIPFLPVPQGGGVNYAPTQ
jgi:hypothetical protein